MRWPVVLPAKQLLHSAPTTRIPRDMTTSTALTVWEKASGVGTHPIFLVCSQTDSITPRRVVWRGGEYALTVSRHGPVSRRGTLDDGAFFSQCRNCASISTEIAPPLPGVPC